MLLIGNIRMDGRVQKEVATLRSHGFHVTRIQWMGERGYAVARSGSGVK